MPTKRRTAAVEAPASIRRNLPLGHDPDGVRPHMYSALARVNVFLNALSCPKRRRPPSRFSLPEDDNPLARTSSPMVVCYNRGKG